MTDLDEDDAVPAPALPGSRWRRMPAEGTRGASGRVRAVHTQALWALRLLVAYLAAAAVAAALGRQWLALHLFLAGGLVLAISGVTSMLTVTWSAAPAPPRRWVVAQLGCIASGAIGVAAGVDLGLPTGVVVAAALTYVAGLAILVGILVATVRRGVERRFDVAVLGYVTALGAGIAGVALGASMAAHPGSGLRDAHLALNLLGLVGLTVSSTMPFFAGTVGRSRMAGAATPTRLAVLTGWQTSVVTATATALAVGADRVAAAALIAYACGLVATLLLLPRPTRRQLRWAGPRLIALWAGTCWWTVSVLAAAGDAAGGRGILPGRWLGVLAVAGFGQILWGSLAYLLPVLRGGGHQMLSEGFGTTRSWIGLAAVNGAGVALVAGAPGTVTAVPAAVWVVDGALRVARVWGPIRPRRRDGSPAGSPAT